MPKGAPKLFLEAWELRPSEVHLVRPCIRPNHAETAASAGHDLVCIQGDSRQTHNVKPTFRQCFTCRTCTHQWRSNAQVLGHASRTPCGPAARVAALRGKRRFWARMSPKWRGDVAKAWALTSKEKCTLNAACRHALQGWVHDLTQENIHPHPGSSLLYGPLTPKVLPMLGTSSAKSKLKGLTSSPGRSRILPRLKLSSSSLV